MFDQANVGNTKHKLLTETSKGKRLGKSISQLSLSQIYPAPIGAVNLNTCGNPDCGNYGIEPDRIYESFRGRNAGQRRFIASLKNSGISMGVGRYRIQGGSDDSEIRNSIALEYADDLHSWDDNRSIECQHAARNSECGIQFTVLSNEHFAEEKKRLLSQNGLLDGPSCGHCGTTYLSAPDEFVFNGANGKKKTARGKPKATGVRIIHKPCKGHKGARFTVSQSHIRQQNRRENIRILKQLVNDASINVLQRLLIPAKGKRKVGVKRIYDRIFWLEKTLLAYEQAQLSEWRFRLQRQGRFRHTRIAHDDIVLGVNWETSRDRRITSLNCATSADIRSGFVFRLDVDFDPTVDPVRFISDAYLGENGNEPALRKSYTQKSGKKFTAPLMHFQRPSGRYEEAALFAFAESQLRLFAEKVADATDRVSHSQTDLTEWAIHDAHEKADQIALLANKYVNFQESARDSRNSFSGIMTKDTYTKAAHLSALKEVVPFGKITLVGEQEAAMARTVPHIFRDMIKDDLFEWHVITFDKKATKPTRQKRAKEYDKKFRAFRRSHPELAVWEALEAWTAENLSAAVNVDQSGNLAPFPISNFASNAFPSLWLHSPIQASGETDKVVGFPILSPRYRKDYKRLGIQAEIADEVMSAAIARRVIHATIQPASTFMNSLRERLSFAKRAGGRSSRSGDTYVNGACYNPRVLIALLNIFRVHYNFFELRTYVTPINKHEETEYVSSGTTSIAVPGTEERITVPKRRRLAPLERTPAMRAGIHQAPIGDEEPKLPDLSRVLYQPWLFHGTPLWSKLQGR